MAALASGIFSHAASSAQSLIGAGTTPMSSPSTDSTGTSGTSSSSTDSSTISSNDFLTLLVTEMKNQDPTADTDPNEYINQLVNVNSLQQLISINQNLSTALGTTSSSSSSSSATDSTPAVSATQSGTGAGGSLAAASSAAQHTAGNLSTPATAPAAQTVAHALDGLPHAQSIARNRLSSN